MNEMNEAAWNEALERLAAEVNEPVDPWQAWCEREAERLNALATVDG